MSASGDSEEAAEILKLKLRRREAEAETAQLRKLIADRELARTRKAFQRRQDRVGQPITPAEEAGADAEDASAAPSEQPATEP